MASRKRKTRSSIKICEENFSCKEFNSEATVECTECKSFQCESCDTSLHTNQRNRYHDRKAIEKPNVKELCQEGQCSNQRNYADVWCDDCQTGFCYICDTSKHKQKRKAHQRRPFDSLSFEQNITTNVEEISLRNNEESEPLIVQLRNGQNEEDSFHSTDYQTTTFNVVNTSVSSQQSSGSKTSLPDIIDDMGDHQDLILKELDDENYRNVHGFLLVDSDECMQVASPDQFVEKLGCENETQVKVVSIFGNTGDGKSHTLNHTFFGGKEIFKTSASQDSCTMGAWAAFDPVHNAIVIDTEGLLGVTSNSNRRTRLLLKILAISDVIIYRTKAERLHDDLFHFLGDASKAYKVHFSRELSTLAKKCHLNMSSLGPSVIIFHETLHTNTLEQDLRKPAEEVLREKFSELEIKPDAFSSLHYVGTKTQKPPTDFKRLLGLVKKQLKDTSVRSQRKPLVIYDALQVLNQKFSGEIEKFLPASFPDQYFTCTSKCLACGCRCSKTINHHFENILHESDNTKKCRYQHQYENKVYLCKVCHDKGLEVIVVPKATSSKDSAWLGLASYAWSGYVLECYNCGVIYRSRQYWYGNQDPENLSVRTEIRHVWPGSNPVLQGTHNAARRVVDGLTYMSDAIASVSAKPAKVVGNWVTDQIAPPYWVPNAMIKQCYGCSGPFTESISIHHCRACGQGFCDDCSSKKRPVPERGWGLEPVRVCDNCFDQTNYLTDSNDSETGDGSRVTLRMGAEVVSSTMATVVSYPLGALKESSRPSYWIPDEEIVTCCVCRENFGLKLRIHHCRSCGQGVCHKCSPRQKAVPSRGWDHPVRVCRNCEKKL